MTARAKRSAHAELDELRQQAATERVKARELEAEEHAARAEIAAAADAVVRAYADQNDAAAKKATLRRDKAERAASDLADRQAAARVRIDRAERAVSSYEREHARELIAELEPAATEATDALRHHATGLIEAHRRWHDTSQQITRLLGHVPHASPAVDAPRDHALADGVRAVRNALRAGDEIRSPLPHWAGLRDHEIEQKTRRLVLLRRKRKLAAKERAELDRITRELNAGRSPLTST
jgi:hypothetical protein